MSDIRSQLEDWQVGLTQAQRFAARDNFFEAVGRLKVVLADIDGALTAEGLDPKVRGRVERLRFQVAADLKEASAKFDAWNARIAEIREAQRLGAEEEMKRPLPVPAD